ncbi:MAG: glycerate kinase [Marinoscillum sp.]
MNILVCPNSYKGALDAASAAKAISAGLTASNKNIKCTSIPIADGGDGSLPVIAKYLHTEECFWEVEGPLGKLVDARFGWFEDGRFAVIELAEASGIRLVEELDPWGASSIGTGQLIKRAIQKGATRIYLTIGGSATVDGALGLLHALGVKFLEKGVEIENPKPSDFQRIDDLDADEALELLSYTKLTILCDVTNPLLGDKGAVAIFGPQKGLKDKGVVWFEKSFKAFANLIETKFGRHIHDVKYGGAAGGIAAVLYGVFGAELVHGGEQILEWANFNQHLSKADVVITGEGRIDSQTNFGKGPGLVALKAKDAGKKVIGLSGAVALNPDHVDFFDVIIPITNGPCTLEEAMTSTSQNLERSGRELGKLLSLM